MLAALLLTCAALPHRYGPEYRDGFAPPAGPWPEPQPDQPRVITHGLRAQQAAWHVASICVPEQSELPPGVHRVLAPDVERDITRGISSEAWDAAAYRPNPILVCIEWPGAVRPQTSRHRVPHPGTS